MHWNLLIQIILTNINQLKLIGGDNLELGICTVDGVEGEFFCLAQIKPIILRNNNILPHIIIIDLIIFGSKQSGGLPLYPRIYWFLSVFCKVNRLLDYHLFDFYVLYEFIN